MVFGKKLWKELGLNASIFKAESPRQVGAALGFSTFSTYWSFIKGKFCFAFVALTNLLNSNFDPFENLIFVAACLYRSRFSRPKAFSLSPIFSTTPFQLHDRQPRPSPLELATTVSVEAQPPLSPSERHSLI